MLSIAINAWPGTDIYRFRLQLETLIYSAPDKKSYLSLCKELLAGWDRNKLSIPSDHFQSAFSRYNFSRCDFDSEQIEMILALDGASSEIADEFSDWCQTYNIVHRQIAVAHVGCAAMRNVAMQLFKNEMLMFRDDDDFSAPIGKLLEICTALKRDGFGDNDLSYQLRLPSYNNVTERYTYFHQHQRHPTIAILMNSIKLKNTWGSVDNPFSVTPVPVDTSKIEIVDRSPFTSMCSKVFSREAIRLIYNSTCCGSLEDARSHYLQQLPQHCIWLFDEEKLKWIRDGWRRRSTEVVRWLNMNVLTYQEWQVDLKSKHTQRSYTDVDTTRVVATDVDELDRAMFTTLSNVDELDRAMFTTLSNVDELDRAHEQVIYLQKLGDQARADYIIKNCFRSCSYSPSFCYVLASGSYSSVNWAYGSVVGLLEAFRNSGRELPFTIRDLRQLKHVIQNCVKTTLVNTNNVSKLEWKSDEHVSEGNELVKLLTPITNYRYLFWFAVVHRRDDWGWLANSMLKIRELLPTFAAEVDDETVAHPNSSIEVNVDGKLQKLSLSNTDILSGDLDDLPYTATSNKPQLMTGGSERSPNLVYLLFVMVVVLIILILAIVIRCQRSSYASSTIHQRTTRGY